MALALGTEPNVRPSSLDGGGHLSIYLSTSELEPASVGLVWTVNRCGDCRESLSRLVVGSRGHRPGPAPQRREGLVWEPCVQGCVGARHMCSVGGGSVHDNHTGTLNPPRCW